MQGSAVLLNKQPVRGKTSVYQEEPFMINHIYLSLCFFFLLFLAATQVHQNCKGWVSVSMIHMVFQLQG